MLKHTPGPWYCVMDNGTRDFERPGVDAPDGELSVVFAADELDGWDGVWGRNRAEALANARLISEAPAMLEALREAESVMAQFCTDEVATPTINRIREILARLDKE